MDNTFASKAVNTGNGALLLGTANTKPYWNNRSGEAFSEPPDGYMFQIGDTRNDPILNLAWNVCDGKLFQTNVHLKWSWADMIQSGFIRGREIIIDGFRFHCRLPIIDEDHEMYTRLPSSISYWACSTKWMEQQACTLSSGETPTPVTVVGPAREYMRLVLIPICPALEQLHGKPVRLLVDNCILTATLLEISGYDLLCGNVRQRMGHISNQWAQWNVNLDKLCISKDAVLNACEIM